jgi:hypothetical protein
MSADRPLALRVIVCREASAFDPSVLSGDDAAVAVREWAAIANAAQAAGALAAARVAECGAPRGSGCRDSAEWLAKQTGTTAARARERIKTGNGLRGAEWTRAAATSGRLSPEQTAAVADAVAANPGAERQLLATAATESVSGLREQCARVKAAADPDPSATEARIHGKRCLRRWRDGEGAEHLHATGTAAQMARIDAALSPIVDDIFNQHRTNGVREPYDAYLFDALVRLADTGSVPNKTSVRHLTLIRVDLETLRRGATESGEVCEIAGLGPIPAARARALLGESILKLVITKGVDVANVTSLGRGPTVAQRIAMLWANPRCSRLDCPRRGHLEVDHRIDWATVEVTELGNLDFLCDPDHDLKTNHGWSLVEGIGPRPFVPPDHPDHPKNKGSPPRRE